MKVVVTGGSGRVGSYVLAEIARHHHVVNADLLPVESFESVVLDVMDLDAVRGAIDGADAVIHLAAIDLDWRVEHEKCMRINTLGTWHVLQAAAELGVRRVVICSSVSAMGLHEMRPDWVPQTLPVTEDHEMRPVDSYSVSKAVVETMGRSFVVGGALEVVCLRPGTVVFEENLAEFANAVDGGSLLCEYVTGEDVARAFSAALEAPAPGFGPYLVVAGDSLTSEPTLDWVKRRLVPMPVIVDPERYARDPRASVFSCDAAFAALGWKPTSSLDLLKQRLQDREAGAHEPHE